MNIYRILPRILIGAGLSLLISSPAFAQTESRTRKKLIQLGWDKPTAATLRANLAQMDQTPFDGALIGVRGKDDNGKEVEARLAFSNVPWKKEWFQQSVDDLKVVRSQAKKLTENFIQVGANPGNVDWFDDAGWEQVIDHFRIAAWIAKEGNLKGIIFDPEAYTKPHRQFDYSLQAQTGKHSFEQYQAKARQRGREVISAIASVDPNLMLYTLFMLSVHENVAKSDYPQAALLSSGYNLYPAFINGWLDAAPPSMIFVDGCEIQGYLADSQLDFLRSANLMRNTALNLVAPENHQKYLSQVQASFGIYLDAYINPPTSFWHIDSEGSTPTKRLQTNVQYAIDAANEYVWIYGEKYRWWPTTNGSVNPQSWGDVLPGVHDALLSTTRPQMIAQKTIAQAQMSGKSINLLKNGDFSEKKPNVVSPENNKQDWNAVGAPAGWSTWQTGYSQGTFSQDDSVNYGDGEGGSARVAGTSSGCFIQAINVKPGESYIASAWMRQTGNGVGWIGVRWQTSAGKWTDEPSDVMIVNPPGSQTASWQKLESVVTVPAHAGKLVMLLSAGGQPKTQDVVWFDDAQIHKTE